MNNELLFSSALISAVEALSKQVLHSISTNPSVLPDVQIENSNKNSKDVQIENYNDTNGQPSSKRKRKRRKQKNSNPSNHAKHEIDKSTSPNVPNVDETGSAQDATPIRHVKETVVIAGDSIVKNIIGAKMGAGDSTHHFEVKPFFGATTCDIEDFIKPLVRKSPKNLIMHVGTNDLRAVSPKNMVESTWSLKSKRILQIQK